MSKYRHYVSYEQSRGGAVTFVLTCLHVTYRLDPDRQQRKILLSFGFVKLNAKTGFGSSHYITLMLYSVELKKKVKHSESSQLDYQNTSVNLDTFVQGMSRQPFIMTRTSMTEEVQD